MIERKINSTESFLLVIKNRQIVDTPTGNIICLLLGANINRINGNAKNQNLFLGRRSKPYADRIAKENWNRNIILDGYPEESIGILSQLNRYANGAREKINPNNPNSRKYLFLLKPIRARIAVVMPKYA